jgi:sphinganine-1-phosphate aldolase
LHTQPGVAEKFINDLKISVTDLMQRDDREMGKMAAIYCSSQGVSDKRILADVAYMYLDACYSTKEIKN